MMTFRDLYGLMTQERKEEINRIRADVGVDAVARDNAEELLFGEDTDIVSEERAGGGFDEFSKLDIRAAREQAEDLSDRSYTQEEIDQGMALNAAVILKDPTRLLSSMLRIQQESEKSDLGLRVVDWQTASGIVGQFVIVIRLVLYIAIIIIFVVALVIINNSMVMATMERVQEIGTMRAIGAQRTFVLLMFLLETAVLGVIASAAGALLAAGTLQWLHSVGIPATTDALVFLFSGPRLHPTLRGLNVTLGFIIIFIVGMISTLYPAFIATRIQPVVAMQAQE
jgi:ABC-type lipoprotein release transport system permease subunit